MILFGGFYDRNYHSLSLSRHMPLAFIELFLTVHLFTCWEAGPIKTMPNEILANDDHNASMNVNKNVICLLFAFCFTFLL